MNALSEADLMALRVAKKECFSGLDLFRDLRLLKKPIQLQVFTPAATFR